MAQDPATALPGNYQVAFENDWVRVLRVYIPAGANVPSHEHPGALIAYVYLTDSDPILFKHDGSNGTITRPAVKARSYRLSTGTVGETHAIENNSATDSIYLRIEYKTEGSQTAQTRGKRQQAPPLKSENAVDVEFTNAAMRITRITIGPNQTMPYEDKKPGVPALIVPLTGDDPHQNDGLVFWVSPDAKHEQIVNSRSEAREYLRFDFLTPPRKS
jgi:hypothetical protein